MNMGWLARQEKLPYKRKLPMNPTLHRLPGVLRSYWRTTGAGVKEFERAFADVPEPALPSPCAMEPRHDYETR
jgi:hypothetical protein